MNNFDEMMGMLRDKIRFSWSRWGDGEWNCILGVKGANCDGHEYFPDMGAALKAVLESRPIYYLGLQTMGVNLWRGNPEFERLVSLNQTHWGNSEILHGASMAGRLGEFFKFLEMNENRIVFVGNVYLKALPVPVLEHIEVPLKNCWREYQSIKKELSRKIIDGDIILYSAGMMSKVLIDVFHELPITQIDTGSVLDPYAGRCTRVYHQTLKIIKEKK